LSVIIPEEETLDYTINVITSAFG